MRRVFPTLTVTLLLTAFVLVGAVGHASAAPIGPTIAPTYIDHSISPGGTYAGTVTVSNQTSAPFLYSVYATPYTVYGENYTPSFSPVKGAINPASWFSFGSAGRVLPKGQDDTVPFKITVPANTGAGSYFATIFAETSQSQGESGIITRERVGTVMYIQVLGKATTTGHVVGWSVPWLQSPEFHASLQLADTGSIYTRSQEKIVVSDAFGGTKYTYGRDYPLLPQKIRQIPVSWPHGATFGLFRITGTVTIFKTTKLPTRYVFIATPLMRVVVVLLLIVLMAVILFAGKRTKPRTPKQGTVPYNESSPNMARKKQ